MAWLIFLSGVCNLILALLVLRRSRTRKNIFFVVFVFFTVILIAFDFVFRYVPTIFILQTAYAFAALVAASAFLWILEYLNIRSYTWFKVLVVLPAAALFFGAYIDGFMVKEIQYLTILGYKGINGPGFNLYAVIIALYLLATASLLLSFIQRAHGVERLKMIYIFVGLCGYGFLAILFSLILPTAFKVYDLTLLDAPSSIVFVSATTFAIIKYRLLNIRTLLARSFLYFFLISVVATIFALTALLLAEYFQSIGRIARLLVLMIVSFIVVVSLDPLKRVLAKVTDRIFFKDKVEYQKVLRTISNIIAKEIDLEVLLSELRVALLSGLKLNAADILIKKNTTYQSTMISGKELSADGPAVQHLKAFRRQVITDELYQQTFDMAENDEKHRRQAVVDELERHGIEFCAPVIHDADMKAIIILGHKQSGDVYNTEDINFFENFASQVAVAIEKSQLYESIGEFNVHLQEQINERTRRLKQQHDELQLVNIHLQQLDNAKSEFLSIASHQLRTPVSAIKGYLSMLLDGDFGEVTEKQRDILEDLFESSARLARLINVFLNVSRIESGRFRLEKAMADVDSLVQSVINELQGQARVKHLKLAFHPGLSQTAFHIDADKVRDVILNLVDNAIKYTPHGSVTVRTYLDNGQVHLSVKDTGIGIRPDEVKSLFRKFIRGTGVAQVNTQGSGLGLYIAHRVISEHNGQIWAESRGLGKGSTFHFSIPALTAPPDHKESGQPQDRT